MSRRLSNATKARAKVQAYVEGGLLDKFRRYRAENELTESGALRMLLEMGLSMHDGLKPDLKRNAIREGVKAGQAKFFQILETAMQQVRE